MLNATLWDFWRCCGTKMNIVAANVTFIFSCYLWNRQVWQRIVWKLFILFCLGKSIHITYSWFIMGLKSKGAFQFHAKSSEHPADLNVGFLTRKFKVSLNTLLDTGCPNKFWMESSYWKSQNLAILEFWIIFLKKMRQSAARSPLFS